MLIVELINAAGEELVVTFTAPIVIGVLSWSLVACLVVLAWGCMYYGSK